jgi:hypothetical protein
MNTEMESFCSENKETEVSIEGHASSSTRNSLRDSSVNTFESTSTMSPGLDEHQVEPDVMVQQALAFVRMVFGQKWVEKAAQTQRYLVKLQRERRDLEETVAIANDEIRRKGDENRTLSAKVDQMAKDGRLLEIKNADLERKCDGLRSDIKDMETVFHSTRAGERQTLLEEAERAFGQGSDIYHFIAELSDTAAIRLGHACICTLPWVSAPGRDPSPPPPLPTLNALGNKFLENISRFDGPERPKLLNLAADHLSRISQNFTFASEEGQLFNPERHTARMDHGIPPGARVRRITSFFVANNRTDRIQQLAEVMIEAL